MTQKRNLAAAFVIAALLTLGLAIWPARPALAHERVEIGPYVVIIGWENEPPIVGERNALVLDVTRDDTPVEGVEGTLEVRVVYAGRSFTGNVTPTATPGHYTIEIFPTVRGQYSLELGGQIEETAVDVTVEPEEVLPASTLHFPEPLPDPQALQTTVDDLSAQLQTARLLAIAGIVVGVLGLALAVFALVRGRRS
ncbi:MAG: hypothetical protein L0332_01320 [Chloroflexi bacterium]|nr:hypothetical protein [Chloroflexota bacterium]MCI0577420.1 hypothetical protein [Chloroflexota bacterium]MCI0725362.1 hypothetical protein [Chloroflexota bacterium]